MTILLDFAKYNYNGELWMDTTGTDTIANRYDLQGVDDAKLVLDSVVVNVRLSNYSFYRYRATVYANSGSSSSYAPEISLYENSGTEQGYNGDIFGDLSELFSELGVQESFQAYTNVNGGFGHFSFMNQSVQVIPVHAEMPDPDYDNNYD